MLLTSLEIQTINASTVNSKRIVPRYTAAMAFFASNLIFVKEACTIIMVSKINV